MNVIVARSDAGNDELAQALHDALLEAGHSVCLYRLPEGVSWLHAAERAAAVALLPFGGHGERLIALDAASSYVRHPGKVVWCDANDRPQPYATLSERVMETAMRGARAAALREARRIYARTPEASATLHGVESIEVATLPVPSTAAGWRETVASLLA